jgi:putative transposase
MLARVFGCCRVVFNDALRVRNEAFRAGERLSDTEIQRRVITHAKTTVEREWLCEMPSVALVQSVNGFVGHGGTTSTLSPGNATAANSAGHV